MFGSKDKKPAVSGGTTLISKNTEIIGDIRFSGNLEIEGQVKGNVLAEEGSDAQVRVLNSGRVEGEIAVPSVVINGVVVGDVHSSKHLELAAKAEVQGNVHYHLIEMVKGSQVNGSLVQQVPAKVKKPEPVAEIKPVTSNQAPAK